MQFVFVYQREPHAGQLAFVDVQQPKDLGERVELARRTCTDMEIAPASIWVDGMDDQSRALFGDLPSPAIVIDPLGVVRAKLPWAEPDLLAPLLTKLLAGLRDDVQAELAREPTHDAEGRRRGAQLWTELWTPRADTKATEQPPARNTKATLPWIAATGTLPAGQLLPTGDEWLTLVAAATLVTAHPDDGRTAEWIATLAKATQPPVRHWALQRELERLRRAATPAANDTIPAIEVQLAALRREHPWLVTPR